MALFSSYSSDNEYMGGHGYGTCCNVHWHRRCLRSRLFPDGSVRQEEEKVIRQIGL